MLALYSPRWQAISNGTGGCRGGGLVCREVGRRLVCYKTGSFLEGRLAEKVGFEGPVLVSSMAPEGKSVEFLMRGIAEEGGYSKGEDV